MKALVYHGPGKKAWEARPGSNIEARPTQSCRSQARRSAALICTSSRATSRGVLGRSSGTRRLGLSNEIGSSVTPSPRRPGPRFLHLLLRTLPILREATTDFALVAGDGFSATPPTALQAEYAPAPSPTPPPTRSPTELTVDRCSCSRTSSRPYEVGS